MTVHLMPQMPDFVQNQGAHIDFVTPSKLNNLLNSEKNGVLTIKKIFPVRTFKFSRNYRWLDGHKKEFIRGFFGGLTCFEM